jgi:hypothetical protein
MVAGEGVRTGVAVGVLLAVVAGGAAGCHLFSQPPDPNTGTFSPTGSLAGPSP